MSADEVREVVAEVVGVELSEGFEDTVVDELMMVEIAMTLEEEFSFSIPDDEVLKFQNVGDLLKYVADRTA